MRVIVPFTNIQEGVVAALTEQWGTVELRSVAGDELAYFRLLRDLWGAGETFCIVEHDIIVPPEVLAGLDVCTREWCEAPYAYLGGPDYYGLGCARFRPALMQRYPDLMSAVWEHDYPDHGNGHWCTLDAAIKRELWARGEQSCTGHQHVEHLHDTPTHGCCG